MFKNPKEMFDSFAAYLSSFPRTEAQVKDYLTKVKKVFDAEAENSLLMWKTYEKASLGQATMNEIDQANKKLMDLFKLAGLAWLFVVPGSMLFLPVLITFARDNGVDIVPTSIAREFNI